MSSASGNDTAAPGQSRIGRPQTRIDGPAKVMGRAPYPSDEPTKDVAYAFLLTSTIARGRVRHIETEDALALDGVLDVLTHWNVGDRASTPQQQAGGKTTTTLESDRVWHDGQIIGVVVATSYEVAREAAYRTRVEYDSEPPSATFGSDGVVTERREPGEHQDYSTGDFEAAFAAAPCRFEAEYATPTQHHNALEPYTTTCAWQDDQLTIWEPSQFVYGLRGNVAQQLGIERERVRVVSKFVGGAFGGKGGATSRTAWIALAAHRVGRPVKLVATRDQGYTIASYRAETRHRIRLAATQEGKLLALRHEGWELTSRPSEYNVSGTETTARLYDCANVQTCVNVAHADRNTPGFMRAPPETPYMFALESAIDELAVELGIDPVELRRRNDAAVDPVTGRPWSSRNLMACFDAAGQRFGWDKRNPQPGSMTDGDWLIGLGCASAAYPANIAATAARARMTSAGRAIIEIAAHDIGNGAATVIAIVAGERLGLDPADVEVRIGDTAWPAASLAAGSSHTATIAHAVAAACDALKAKIDTGAREAYAETVPEGAPPDAIATLYSGKPPIVRGHGRHDVTAYAFGAHFVEVRVHRLTREIRVARMVSAFAAGTIVNPLTARSQFMGGMIWGIGSALLEKTEIDRRHARYVNDNLAEYLVAVNADVNDLEIIMLPEADATVNEMGIKGVGEIGIVGVNAAIANAVFHATGRRIRELPIRIENLL